MRVSLKKRKWSLGERGMVFKLGVGTDNSPNQYKNPMG